MPTLLSGRRRIPGEVDLAEIQEGITRVTGGLVTFPNSVNPPSTNRSYLGGGSPAAPRANWPSVSPDYTAPEDPYGSMRGGGGNPEGQPSTILNGATRDHTNASFYNRKRKKLQGGNPVQ